MAEVLLVVRPFQARVVGDLITETNDISDVIAGEHVHHVIRVLAPMCDVHEEEA